MTILDEIAAERRRQVAKDYDAAHDDKHALGEIGSAAAACALMASGRITLARDAWPWREDLLSEHTPRQLLISAAALCIAEIERRDRQEGQCQK